MLTLYQLNPITGAVGLMHYGVWFPTTDQSAAVGSLIGSDNILFGLIGLMLSLVLLVIGQIVFRKLEKSFAQNL